MIIYDICCKKFADNPTTIIMNLAKYLGMLIREAVYYSDVESKKLKNNDYQKNREIVINGRKK